MIRKSERVRKIHSDIRGPLYEEALRMQAAGLAVPPEALRPEYLRLSQAERERAERLARENAGG